MKTEKEISDKIEELLRNNCSSAVTERIRNAQVDILEWALTETKKSIKIETRAGDSIDSVIDKAIVSATVSNRDVEFFFNGILCIVNKSTNPRLLSRDYSNSYLMGWEEVGPACVEEYSGALLEEYNTKKEERAQREKAESEKYAALEKEKLESLKKRLEGISLALSNEQGWMTGRENNKDPYGAATYDFAENWARLMQVEIATGKTLEAVAEQTSRDADIGGITGFMYVCAVSILVQTWERGEELKKWHYKTK